MITKKQKEVLSFVESYNKKKGYSPSLEEIRKRFKLSSVSTAHYYIKQLDKLGYLEKKKIILDQYLFLILELLKLK